MRSRITQIALWLILLVALSGCVGPPGLNAITAGATQAIGAATDAAVAGTDAEAGAQQAEAALGGLLNWAGALGLLGVIPGGVGVRAGFRARKREREQRQRAETAEHDRNNAKHAELFTRDANNDNKAVVAGLQQTISELVKIIQQSLSKKGAKT